MSLAHSTVVILGGSSGIGLSTAKAAKAEGARVVATGRSADRLKSAQALLGAEARTVALDEAGTRALFEELDRVAHVFITAGIVVLDSGLAPDSASLRPAHLVKGFPPQRDEPSQCAMHRLQRADLLLDVPELDVGPPFHVGASSFRRRSK